jgi:hypothetical protein
MVDQQVQRVEFACACVLVQKVLPILVLDFDVLDVLDTGPSEATRR